jgi:hypothetical protein
MSAIFLSIALATLGMAGTIKAARALVFSRARHRRNG